MFIKLIVKIKTQLFDLLPDDSKRFIKLIVKIKTHCKTLIPQGFYLHKTLFYRRSSIEYKPQEIDDK